MNEKTLSTADRFQISVKIEIEISATLIENTRWQYDASNAVKSAQAVLKTAEDELARANRTVANNVAMLHERRASVDAASVELNDTSVSQTAISVRESFTLLFSNNFVRITPIEND